MRNKLQTATYVQTVSWYFWWDNLACDVLLRCVICSSQLEEDLLEVVLEVLGAQHQWWWRMRTRRMTLPIGNIVSQSDSVTATAETTATAAACISSLVWILLLENTTWRVASKNALLCSLYEDTPCTSSISTNACDTYLNRQFIVI